MIQRLCLVLGHGGQTPCIGRHLPIWRKFHDEVILCTPADDPVKGLDVWQFTWGKSGHYCADTNLRTREALTFAGAMNFETLTLCEYDALLWRWPADEVQRILRDRESIDSRDPGFIFGSRFWNDDVKFQGKFYLHTPLIMDRLAVWSLVEAMEDLPDDAEGGFGDRYIGLAAERAEIGIIDGHKLGLSYSQNQIEAKHYAPMAEAIRSGICFTHGIKHLRAFEVGLQAAKISY